MPANQDFRDLFSTFNDENVEYLVIGAHAVMYFAAPRYTKDLDVWVNPTPQNARRVWSALEKFGAPLVDITADDFLKQDLVYQIGVEPNRIDILVGIRGVVFSEAFRRCVRTEYDGVPIPILAKEDLIAAKRASGRPQDLLDIRNLEEQD